jgi:allophanate hydrolase subunit 1
LTQDYGPDEQELKANELAQQADLEALNKLLESSDALATAHAEIKRLNLAYAQLDIRFKGLMNEKSEAVRLLQKAQLEIKALRKAKK